MKKILALTLALMMLTMCFVACGNNTDNQGDDTTTPADDVADTTPVDDETTPTDDETTPATELAYNNALELLQIILEKYNATASEETKMYVGGGNINNFDTVSFDGPAAFIALENEDYNQNLGFPTAEVGKIVSAASMFHNQNVNILTCYAVQLADGTDVDATVNTLKDNILARQWDCGHPEKLFITKAPGNYLIVTWGVVESGGITELVAQSIPTSVEGATIVVDQSLIQ